VHGQQERYVHVRVGVGGRMDTLQCAVVLGKLQRFEWEIERRKELGAEYARRIAGRGAAVQLLAVRPDRDCVWAQFTVMVEARDPVQAALRDRGIPTAVHYPLSLNMQPAYRRLCCAECTPNSHEAAKRVLSLPMSADLTQEDVSRVTVALGQATNT
jgi:UDP-2-acetamido-2-deoxy-ribo-hexuluronate aminotransferase